MPRTRLTLRFPAELLTFLTQEAGRNGLSISEYVKNLIARGLHAQELENIATDLKTTFAALPIPSASPSAADPLEPVKLEALFEIRALLRLIATSRDATLVTTARTQARQDVQALLGAAAPGA